MTNILLVHNSIFVSMMMTKPVGKVRADMSVAMLGLLARRPGAPPAIMMSKPAPREMKIPARKDSAVSFSLHCTCVSYVGTY